MEVIKVAEHLSMKTTRFLSTTIALALVSIAPRASAVIYDLNATGTVIVPTVYGDAIFTVDYTQPAGTGVFDPFLTIQANGVEQGYNSSTSNFDTKREPQWNHELQLSDLTTTTVNGVEYYSFLLDINEPNSTTTSMISLDVLKIFTASSLQGAVSDVETLGTKRFDLDLPVDGYIKYDDLNSGSGQADIAFFIPTASFLTGPNAASGSDYVYMYQQFGSNYSANTSLTSQGGFEETRLGAASFTPVPEPSAFIPLLTVLGAVIAGPLVRRRMRV